MSKTTSPAKLRRPIGFAAAAAAVLMLTACGSSDPQVGAEPAVTLDSTTSASPTPSTTAGSGSAAASPQAGNNGLGGSDDFTLTGAATLADDLADLDVEDQRGDGRSVKVDEARSGQAVTLIGIYDAGQKLLGSGATRSGAQLVTIKLDRPITTSQELFAVLHADTNGNGTLDAGDAVLVEEGEQVTEDFDYVLS